MENTLDSSAQNNISQKKFKIVFLGDQGVGKTSIIKRFIYETFDDNNAATIGVDLISKTLNLDGRTIRLNLWDTAGQERFRCLIPGYIRDSNVAIVVYDITRRETFTNVKAWIDEVRQQRDQDVVVALIGCKSDLADQRVVSQDEGTKYAHEIKGIFFEVSAKTGENITQTFQNLVNQLLGTTGPSSQTNIRDPNTVGAQEKFQLDPRAQDSEQNKEPEKKKTGCC